MQTFTYVLVGGGVASQSAAESIRARDALGSILILAGEPHLPYRRPPLSKAYLLRPQAEELAYLKGPDFYADNSIVVWKGVRCSAIDRARRTLTIEDGEEIGYSRLLLATGAQPWRPPVPGGDLPGVYTLATLEDAAAIREATPPGARALVVGGGFVGSEVAASLVQRGAAVTMAFMEARLQQRLLPAELGEYIARMYAERGVRMMPSTTVVRFSGEERVTAAAISNGEVLAVDLVVIGAGVRPNTALARQAGLMLDANGGIAVDDHLRTSDPDIYAAGDVASWPDRTFGKRLRVEHLEVARRQGAIAGANMAGADESHSAMPYFFTSLFDLRMEFWGDLSSWDATVLRGQLEAGPFCCFYFHQGIMVGAMAGRGGEDERTSLPGIVAARLPLESSRLRLSDATVPLSSLLT